MNLKTISKEKTSINAFSSKKFETTELEKVCINLKINSCGNFSMEVLCKPFICLPITNQPVKYAENNFEFLKDLNLADSGTVEEIDMFIGSNFYWSLATGKVKMGKTGEPVAIKTKFGWVLYEPLNEKASQVQVTVVNETKTHVLNLCFEPTKISDPTKTESLEIDLKKLWDQETLDIIQKKLSMHDHFIKSIHLNNERRCETNLPFKENLPVLYDHFDLCKNRLEQLFKKLENDTELLKKYNDVFSEQLKQGIIEEAPKDFKVGECQYLSHHAVFREDKSTSKIRIVFDTSAKIESPSLNDCVCKGPQLTPLIFHIPHRFQTYPVALTSDIEKAFLQISTEHMEQNCLRFLWYDDVFYDFPKLKRLRFARVIFGVISSPFLLNGTIRKHIGN